ncbi:MAG: hypothetical protein EB127_15645 [Alphaproteobacteria bacterium]|nr:hypothetical protein [Alphaproteobacteria bacterium]
MPNYTIPDSVPETQSFLYMPLIFHSMDPSVIRVTFPDKFIDVFNTSIKISNKQITEIGLETLPFTDVEGFRNIITGILKEKNLYTYANLEKQFDGPFHLPGIKQTDILYNDDAKIEIFLNNLVNNVIKGCKGKLIRVEKNSRGGNSRRRRRNRGRKSRRR